ncbi:MAG: UDP-N-acetylmuramate--L-alanine ligase [Candidatus Aerophobetes bacterium]|nr:UDP-N-acetylmuramate--L-alanine ligase [Candidatus Aerophobetes bacterium]
MLSKVKSIHFIGIGGAGMSGLAKVLLEMGYKVSGSDVRENKFTEGLKIKGATIYRGHSPSHINNADVVAVSSAILPENPELKEAKRKNTPLLFRGQLLAYLTNERENIIIAGTHGKTTTTSLVYSLLRGGGRNPTIFIGGEDNTIGSTGKLGDDEYVVAESDESDGSFLFLHPKICILTSLEDDHLDFYKSKKNLLNSFVQFVERLKPEGTLIINRDDEQLREILERTNLHPSQKLITYGINSRAELCADKIRLKEFTSLYRVKYKGDVAEEIKLSLAGEHNIYNSLGAIGVGISLKIGWDKMKKSLSSFRGVKRRFEKIGETSSRVLVIGDFAHHPTEIEKTLTAAKRLNRRIITVFQPHRYTRTKILLPRFTTAFKKTDILLLTSIYAAGERPLPGISGKLLFEEIRKQRKEKTHYFSSTDQIINFLKKKTTPGDLLLILGAGDIGKVSKMFLQEVN